MVDQECDVEDIECVRVVNEDTHTQLSCCWEEGSGESLWVDWTHRVGHIGDAHFSNRGCVGQGDSGRVNGWAYKE